MILDNGGTETTLVSYEPPFSELADGSYEVKSDQNWGQTFTHSGGASVYSVYKAGVVLSRAVDAAAGQVITVSIRESWNGAVLGSASIPVEAISTSEAWYEFDLGHLALNDAQTYYIRVENTHTNGKVYLGVDGSGTYADGDLINKDGVAESGKDAAFRLIQIPNIAPTLDIGKAPVLNSIAEDSGAPVGAVGTLVSSLVDFASPAGQVDNVSDPDSNALLGIAVTWADSANGTWWYSINDGGTWNLLGSVSDANARLLSAEGNGRIYFQPTADYHGSNPNALTFRAWDQTSGLDGGTADTTTNGGNTAFSTAVDTAVITVTAVNDAPTAANNTVATNEDTPYTFTAADFNFSDIDGDTLASVKITSLETVGALQLSGADVTLNQVISRADIDAGNLKFVPVGDQNGTGYDSFDFRVNDGTVDSVSGYTMSVDVTAVNDAPVITSDGSGVTAAVNVTENTTAVTTVTSTDVDGGTPSYSISGGADAAKFTIDANTGELTFVAAPDYETPTDAGGDNVYDVTVQVDDGNGNTDSQTLAVTVTDVIEQTYPTSSGQDNSLEWITNVTFAGINNTTGREAGGYGDYTNLVGSVDVGSSYDLSVTINADSQEYVNAWIDWNKDGDFLDVGESYTLVANTGLNGPHTVSIAAPIDAVGGTTVMRVSVKYQGAPASDAVFQYGEVEDYAISVTPTNSAPVLAGANDLSVIDEDIVGDGGMLVSSLIAGQVTDADGGALSGIAVTAVDNTNGTWEYTTDGGSTWTAFGAVDTANARLLAADANTSVRFVPDTDWNGTVTDGITFHAWDQTSGTAGGTADLSSSADTVRDDFSTAAYTNNDGTANWTSAWSEVGDDGSATTGNIRIEGGALYLDNLDGVDLEGVTRQLNLDGATTAALTFDYAGYAFSGTDSFSIRVSDDGGSTWVELENVAFVDDPGTNFSGSRSFDLGSYVNLTADMVVRFQISAGFAGAGQHVTFDNVQVEYTVGPDTGGSNAFSTATASSSITVNPVNDAPAVANLDGDILNYTEGDGVVLIEQGADALVSDPDSADFSGGTLTVEVDFGLQPAEDVFSIHNEGTAAGQIGVSGNDVTYGGVVIGTFSGGTGLNPLTVVFNSNATPEAVTALIQNITYENTGGDDPTAGARSVVIDVTDGDGGAALTQNLTVNVAAVNDAPTDMLFDLESSAEQIANTYTTGDQSIPSIAAFDDGRYIVVWESNGQDGSGDGIYATIYNADGSVYLSEFQVNVETVDGEGQPSVATFADGGFVIAWRDVVAGSHAWTEARVFNADGTAATGEIVLKTGVIDGTNEAYNPAIVALDNNQFVAVWNGENSSVKELEGAIFDRSGTNLSGLLTLGTLQGNTGQWAGQPEIIALSGGGFAVSWFDNDDAGTNPLSHVRFFDANGVPTSAQIPLGGDGQTDLIQLDNSNVVVVYGDGGHIKAQILDGSGGSVVSEFQVSSSGGVNGEPSVTTTANGGFFVAWQNDAGDADGSAILGQAFDANGTAIANERVLNQTTTGDQTLVELATLADGSVRATWSSAGQDTSGESVVVCQVGTGGYVYENAANGTYVAMVTDVIDPDGGETHSFSLLDNAGGAFTIDANTGVITVADTTKIDFEAASSMNVTVRVTDSGGLTYDEVVTINILDANDVPTAANTTVTTNEDTPYSFTATDFNFSDVDGDSLASVKITSLETVGSLLLNGVDVTLGPGDQPGGHRRRQPDVLSRRECKWQRLRQLWLFGQ